MPPLIRKSKERSKITSYSNQDSEISEKIEPEHIPHVPDNFGSEEDLDFATESENPSTLKKNPIRKPKGKKGKKFADNVMNISYDLWNSFSNTECAILGSNDGFYSQYQRQGRGPNPSKARTSGNLSDSIFPN